MWKNKSESRLVHECSDKFICDTFIWAKKKGCLPYFSKKNVLSQFLSDAGDKVWCLRIQLRQNKQVWSFSTNLLFTGTALLNLYIINPCNNRLQSFLTVQVLLKGSMDLWTFCWLLMQKCQVRKIRFTARRDVKYEWIIIKMAEKPFVSHRHGTFLCWTAAVHSHAALRLCQWSIRIRVV